MRVIISHNEKKMRKDIAVKLSEHYPNCEMQSFSDSLFAAKSVYESVNADNQVDAVFAGSDAIKLIPMMIKAIPSLIIVIVADNPGHCDEAFSLGAKGYVTRPYTNEDLFAAVEGRVR